ncbi:hypothetical protein [Blastopirellula marina]|uniref:Uncharacterized protein n=1 Tax=Blastopirellula marina TaxID=124 RepID=A0A2S8GMZ5_9BACT|nr:hypothetical protein [Blastopirellula marina]PQO45394.1 hypothetical protein C5Y93_13155 [Blastopirellula marina]
MGMEDRTLTEAPNAPRQLELWLQHAAGCIIWEDVRNYAREQIDPSLSEEARSAALEAIDHAVYGLMMLIDGINVPLRNDRQEITLSVTAKLTDRESEQTISELDLFDGDGMCMGYHFWMEGDFGEYPPMEP